MAIRLVVVMLACVTLAGCGSPEGWCDVEGAATNSVLLDVHPPATDEAAAFWIAELHAGGHEIDEVEVPAGGGCVTFLRPSQDAFEVRVIYWLAATDCWFEDHKTFHGHPEGASVHGVVRGYDRVCEG